MPRFVITTHKCRRSAVLIKFMDNNLKEGLLTSALLIIRDLSLVKSKNNIKCFLAKSKHFIGICVESIGFTAKVTQM